MGTKSTRKRYTSEEKIEILKRHLVGRENVSDICDSIGLHPNQFYRWQSELFSGGKVVFEQKTSIGKPSREMKRKQADIERLQKIVDHKDKVIAEVTESYVRLKKNFTDPLTPDGWNRIRGTL